MTQHIELEFLGKNRYSVMTLSTGVERSYKKGWSDGLVWCGSSGLYFSTQPIDLSYPSIRLSLLFYHRIGRGRGDRAKKFIM
jgi:hypothetical protein